MKRRFVILVLCTIALLLGIYVYVGYFLPFSLPDLPLSTVFLDRHGEEIGEKLYSGSLRHRPLEYSEIPPFYARVLIALEDRSFWTNNGISLRGIARSIVRNIAEGKVLEGASTLSSGLIRNALWIHEKRDFRTKVVEFLYAFRMNHILSKESILTEYLNRVSYGYMTYGLESAAIFYFGKKAKYLTQAEQVALLVLPKDPKKYDPYIEKANFQRRFILILDTLHSYGVLRADEYARIRDEKLIWNTLHRAPAPYITDFLAQRTSHTGGLGTLKTTFDLKLTEKIRDGSDSALDALLWRNVTNYGVIVAERGNPPKLRVMIGGRSYEESDAGQVNTTLALRQPGSAMKPFTYALAFAGLGLTPEDTVLDLPTGYKTFEGYSYEPKNYSQKYLGEISLRRALAESVNIPAVKLLDRIGVEKLLEFLHSLGITSLIESPDHYGLALTLGVGEVSLYELLEAYTIFSNSGTYCPFTFLEGEDTHLQCQPRIDAKYTDMVVSILTDRYAKLGGFPIHSALDFEDRYVFVKTGTSRNFRDNWALGFTDHYLIGVWAGNKSGENMKGVSGATGAGEIFRRIVYLLELRETHTSDVTSHADTGSYVMILRPVNGSVYKVETGSSIAPSFDTNIVYDRALWKVDGNIFTGTMIPLTRGDHTLSLSLMRGDETVGEDSVLYTGIANE